MTAPPSASVRSAGRRRLLTLAKFLDERVPRARFSLVSWAREREFKQRACGTVACACGWATTIREFKNAGLSLEMGEPLYETKTNTFDGWEAIENFFALTHEQATRLFSYTMYAEGNNGPDAVAERIRAFVKSGRRR